jgi:hypothetical protein
VGLFKRRKKAVTTGNPLDDDILREIGARSDLSLPRDWVHYIYCASAAGAQTIATAVSQDGWDLQRVDEAASGGGWISNYLQVEMLNAKWMINAHS